MKILNEFIPFPIQLLFLLGLAYSIYKFIKVTSKTDKKTIVFKYLFYLIYFLLVQYFISPLMQINKSISLIFIGLIILLCAIELYKIRNHLNLKYFIFVAIIFIGAILNFRYIGGILKLNIFYCIFIFDGMSQIGGQLLGKHKLSRNISPNKTWEGFITGLVFSVFSMWFIDDYNDYIFIEDKKFSVIFYSIICVFALMGDLFFSKLKRLSKIKDYGNYIPGHGGLLDRVDSLIFTYSIVFYIYFIIFIVLLCTSDGQFLTF